MTTGYPKNRLPTDTNILNDPNDASKQPKFRLKGKARKLAKAATTANDSSLNCPKYRIAIKDFTVLALYIVKQTSVVMIENSVILTLTRLIDKRREFSSMFAAASDKSADSTHSHFLNILVDVRNILEKHPSINPNLQKGRSDSGKKNGDKDMSCENMENRFASLDLEEPSEAFLNAEPPRPQPVSSDDGSRYETKTKEDIWECLFAAHIMVLDLVKIRHGIMWIWINYEAGLDMYLCAAAIATNTAMDLARNIYEHVLPMTKGFGGIWRVLYILYSFQVKSYGVDPIDYIKCTDEELNSNKFTMPMYKLATACYLLAFRFLYPWFKQTKAKTFTFFDADADGFDLTRDRKEKWEEISVRERLAEDRNLLFAIFGEAFTHAKYTRGDQIIQDELLRSVSEMIKTGEFSFSLVFASQISLDIILAAQSRTTRGFATFEKSSKFFLKEIQQLRHLPTPISNDSKGTKHGVDIEKMIKETEKTYANILDDPTYVWKLQISKATGQPLGKATYRHKMLKLSPIMSGLLLFHFA